MASRKPHSHPPLVFLLGLECAVVAVADQVPNAPLLFPVSRTALCDVEPARATLAIAQASEAAPPRVARHLQAAELAPLALEENFDVLFGADDEGDPEFIKQIKEQHIGKAAVGGEQQFGAPQIPQDDFEQAFDKGALKLAPMPFESAFLIRAPVNGHGTTTKDGRSGQRVNPVFDRPIKRDADEGVSGDV